MLLSKKWDATKWACELCDFLFYDDLERLFLHATYSFFCNASYNTGLSASIPYINVIFKWCKAGLNSVFFLLDWFPNQS